MAIVAGEAGLQPVEPQLWPSIGPTSALIGCVGDCVLLGSSPLQSRSVIRTVLELENCDRLQSCFFSKPLKLISFQKLKKNRADLPWDSV